jgi:predicted Holliday junction resolvase-like endonuclease
MIVVVLIGLFLLQSIAFLASYQRNERLARKLGSLMYQNTELIGELDKAVNSYNELREEYLKEKERNDLVISQKKSSEVRNGQILENIVPFLENFPHDVKNTRFLGNPVDLISFNYDDEPGIYFIEVKTGNAQESKRQKILKNCIKLGKVYYQQIRIDKKGVVVKESKNVD